MMAGMSRISQDQVDPQTSGQSPASRFSETTGAAQDILPESSGETAPAICPNCGRLDTLIELEDFVACAACGYSSEGVHGCT